MTNKPLKIAISGALGKMGKQLVKELDIENHAILTCAIIKNKPLHIKKDMCLLKKLYKKNNFLISDCLKNHLNIFDVLIDFTNSKTTMKNVKLCAQAQKKIVIGTTGFTEKEEYNIKQLSHNSSILKSSNYSIGITLMFRLLEITTQIMGKNSDIEIIESHHNKKIDAPSGTAIELGKKIARIMNWDFKKHAVFTRSGLIGPRKKHEIGFSTIRAGNIVGNHTVIFENKDENITIQHKAINRSIFAQGAITAALWLHSHNKNGIFNMNHILNL